jgi:ADP-ribose pyrophosphatase
MASDPDGRLRETLIERESVLSGSYLTVNIDTVIDVAGGQHKREVIVHPGGVTIIPVLSDGRLALVRQYRHAVGAVLLELPAGTLDRADDGSTEDPDAAAVRELAEETGHRATEWRKLVSFFTSPGFASEEMHLYLATGLELIPGYTGAPPEERIEVELIPWADVVGLAQRGAIRDGKSLLAIHRLQLLALAGEVAELRAS